MFAAPLAFFFAVFFVAAPEDTVTIELPRHARAVMTRALSNPLVSGDHVGFVLDADEAESLLSVLNPGSHAAPPQATGTTKAVPAKMSVWVTRKKFNAIRRAFRGGSGIKVKLDRRLAESMTYNVACAFDQADAQRLLSARKHDPGNPNEPWRIRDDCLPGGYYTGEHDRAGHNLWFNPETKTFYYYQ